ncbi:MAG: AAA family ATPase [Chloroflexi bacterium]|nr:AAA family ATPase [Chloroflexota bacterium]
MYKRFEVHNFRGFRELVVDELERVNLIAGLNNVGKTAFLEALFLHCGAYNPALTIRVSAFRGMEYFKIELPSEVEAPWNSLFHQLDLSKTIKLAGENTITGHRSLELRALREPSELARAQQFIRYDSDKAQGIQSSLELAKVLELKYEERERQGNFYLIFDPKPRIEPIPPTPPFPAIFQGARMRVPFMEEAERFGQLEIRGEQDVLLEKLQLIEPRLKRLATVIIAGQPVLHGDIGIGRLLPLPIMGEGMLRLASVVLNIANAPKGVVLLDEIENGLHHSILTKVWQAIGKVARQYDTQVFATTHSLECIVAAHRAFTEAEVYDFRLHRLERIEDTIRAITYDQETLEAAIETGLEVR